MLIVLIILIVHTFSFLPQQSARKAAMPSTVIVRSRTNADAVSDGRARTARNACHSHTVNEAPVSDRSNANATKASAEYSALSVRTSLLSSFYVFLIISQAHIKQYYSNTPLFALLIIVFLFPLIICLEHIAKCREGCHAQNGFCVEPDQCQCKMGWRGENCTECDTEPGCLHGTCDKPLECLCEPGWTGPLCSSRKYFN